MEALPEVIRLSSMMTIRLTMRRRREMASSSVYKVSDSIFTLAQQVLLGLFKFVAVKPFSQPKGLPGSRD